MALLHSACTGFGHCACAMVLVKSRAVCNALTGVVAITNLAVFNLGCRAAVVWSACTGCWALFLSNRYKSQTSIRGKPCTEIHVRHPGQTCHAMLKCRPVRKANLYINDCHDTRLLPTAFACRAAVSKKACSVSWASLLCISVGEMKNRCDIRGCQPAFAEQH